MNAPKITLPRIDDGDDARAVTLFDVERYATGELTGDDAARVQKALDADPTLAAVHRELVAADRAFLVSHPPAAFLARVHDKRAAEDAEQQSALARLVARLRSWVSGPLVAAAAAASVVLFVVVQSPTSTSTSPRPADGDGTRTKGGAVTALLSFFVKNADGSARVGKDGEALRQGDQIQLVVTDLPRRAMVVVGVDGDGDVTTYAAEDDATRTTGVLAATPRALDRSLVLDDSAGAERFFVVWGDDLRTLRQRANEAASHLAAGVHAGVDVAGLTTLPLFDEATPQATFHIVKVR